MARFGLQIPNFSLGVPDDAIFERVVETAGVAEECGFHSVWVMDHLYQLPALGGPAQPMLEAYTLLGAIAARTQRVDLGALVTGVTYRNPALVAKQVTTLDVISRGRAILGIGAAWHDTEHEAYGWPFPAARERLDRLEEAVRICRAMFTEEAPTFEGRHYRIKEARNVPRPIRPGGPPIMIGGGGEKRTLRLVAKYADLCNIAGDVAVLERKISALRRHCEEVGRDRGEVTVSRLSTMVLTDSDEQTTAVREMLVRAAGEETAAAFDYGQESEIVDRIGTLIDVGVQYFTINMPLSDPDTIGRAATLLVKNFS